MIKRTLENYLLEAMEDTPVVAILGARQVGKSTLAQKLIPLQVGQRITLDDNTTLQLANDDPVGLIRSLKTPALIDEIQKAPHLTSTIKMVVDENRGEGCLYVITGSADLRAVSSSKSHRHGKGDSMAGRVEWVTLHPLTQAEIAGKESTFIDELVSGEFTEPSINLDLEDIVNKIVTGGYPELQNRTPRRQRAWLKGYLNSTIRSDLESVYNIRNSDEALLLLKSLAVNISGTLVKSNVQKNLSIDRRTTDAYLSSLISCHIIDLLPAWHKNEGKALITAPKINFVDTALVCSLRGINTTDLLNDRALLGDVFEAFVVTEFRRLANLHELDIDTYHYRDAKGRVEVDLMITVKNLSIGMEIKAGSTYQSDWLKHLKKLIDNKVIDRGVVIYTGDQQVHIDEKIWLIPISKMLTF